MRREPVDKTTSEFSQQLTHIAHADSPVQAGQIWEDAVTSGRATHVFVNAQWQGYTASGADLDSWLQELPAS